MIRVEERPARGRGQQAVGRGHQRRRAAIGRGQPVDRPRRGHGQARIVDRDHRFAVVQIARGAEGRIAGVVGRRRDGGQRRPARPGDVDDPVRVDVGHRAVVQEIARAQEQAHVGAIEDLRRRAAGCGHAVEIVVAAVEGIPRAAQADRLPGEVQRRTVGGEAQGRDDARLAAELVLEDGHSGAAVGRADPQTALQGHRPGVGLRRHAAPGQAALVGGHGKAQQVVDIARGARRLQRLDGPARPQARDDVGAGLAVEGDEIEAVAAGLEVAHRLRQRQRAALAGERVVGLEAGADAENQRRAGQVGAERLRRRRGGGGWLGRGGFGGRGGGLAGGGRLGGQSGHGSRGLAGVGVGFGRRRAAAGDQG